MAKKSNYNELVELFKRRDNYINSKLKTLDKETRQLQTNLLNIIVSDYVGKFDIKDGKILRTARNMRMLSELENLINRFNNVYTKDFLVKIANDMLKVTEYTKDYYLGMGYGEKLLEDIEKGMGYISERIGITTKGEIIKGSYLDTLAKTPEIKLKLKDYVLGSIAEGKGFNSFLKGFKELIVGGVGILGSHEKYIKQYVYDTYNRIERIVDNHFATELGVQYFVYMGGLIETSRKFCIERAGKIFSTEEAKKWKDDPDLIVKNRQGYNPIVDMGGPNCRHMPMFISDEMACKKRPDVCGKVETKEKPNEPEFTDAKTIEEAEQWARENGIANKVDYKDLPLDVVNDVNKNLKQLINEYGIKIDEISKRANMTVGDNIMEIKSIRSAIIRDGEMTGEWNKVVRLNINDKFFDVPYYKELLKEQFESNWCYSENIKDLVTHEYGHVLTKSPDPGRELEIFSLQSPNIKTLTRYGNHNYAEAVAELFLKYKKYGSGNLTNEELELLNKYIDL